MAVVRPAFRRYDVYLVLLDPTQGSEIQKTRPCVIVSPDEMNSALRTVTVAPMTTAVRGYPSRVAVTFQRRHGEVALDQIRTVDKQRLVKRLGKITDVRAQDIALRLIEMFQF